MSTWSSTERTLPELTKEEEEVAVAVAIKIAIMEARKRKGQDMYNRVYAKSVREDPQFPVFTAGQFFQNVVNFGIARAKDRQWSGGFVVDHENKSVLTALSLYFTGDRKFLEINDRFSFSKGLLLIGPMGCGKTQLVSLCCENQKQCYLQSNCTEITNEYAVKEGGPAVIEHYSGSPRNTSRDRNFGHELFGVFFDDLGAESNAKHMGNERNVMAEIIQNRYTRLPHSFTHFTSNLTLPELREVYGARVEERIREMCNVIEFPASANSRRK